MPEGVLETNPVPPLLLLLTTLSLKSPTKVAWTVLTLSIVTVQESVPMQFPASQNPDLVGWAI